MKNASELPDLTNTNQQRQTTGSKNETKYNYFILGTRFMVGDNQ